MKKILLFAFTIFASYSPFYSFAQDQNGQPSSGLAQANLPDKTPKPSAGAVVNKAGAGVASAGSGVGVRAGTAGAAGTGAAGITKPSPIKPATIDKSQLLDTGNNIISHTNDLVSVLLGTGKVTSLMCDDEELSDVDRAIESFKNDQTFVPGQDPNSADAKKEKDKKAKDLEAEDENEKSYIYLASIIYYSPKDWAVWINNQKITSETNKNSKELFVKEIYSDHAKILWSLSISKWKILAGKKSDDAAPKLNAKNNVEIEFNLKPNQTFILGSGHVVEGRAVVNLVKEKEGGKK